MDKVKITIIQGSQGKCIAVNDTRVAGPKPMGGGTVVNEWFVDKEYLIEQINS